MGPHLHREEEGGCSRVVFYQLAPLCNIGSREQRRAVAYHYPAPELLSAFSRSKLRWLLPPTRSRKHGGDLLALLLVLRTPVRADVPLEPFLARHGWQDDLLADGHVSAIIQR